MSRLAALGVVYWIAHNPNEWVFFPALHDTRQLITRSRASRLRILTHDTHYDPIILRAFSDKTGLSVGQLEQYGKEVRRRGYLHQRDEKRYRYTSDSECSILRSIRDGWDKVDGTMPDTAEDNLIRYIVGPIWSENSCAVDCAIFCGIMLDAGRLQADQITAAAASQLPRSAHCMRRIVWRLWGLLQPAQRSSMRNSLRVCLHEFNKERFPEAPAQLPLAEVFEACFIQLPQLSFTDVQGQQCCDGNITINNRTRPSRTHCLYATSPPLKKCLQEIFDGRPSPEHRATCSRGPACTRRWSRRRIVLDRLPPTLIVHLPPVRKTAVEAWALFDDIKLTYQAPLEVRDITYHAVGCVLMSGTAATAHFMVVWRARGLFWLYDGMMNAGRVQRVASWLDVRTRGLQVIALILRIPS